jgi:dipeptidyl aminopeptidase/acylaminoacyl peptidase
MSRWGRGSRGGGEDSPLAQVYRETVRDKEFLQLTSPINYFGLVTAPVQIHQGLADNVTPPEWAEAIQAALQAAGREVEYFTYPRQGHALEGESWDLFMERVADFFDQRL